MLNGLPGIAVTNADPPELHRLIEVLDLASKHRQLLRQTQGTADKDLPALAAAQSKLAEAAAKFTEGESSHPMLVTAHGQLAADRRCSQRFPQGRCQPCPAGRRPDPAPLHHRAVADSEHRHAAGLGQLGSRRNRNPKPTTSTNRTPVGFVSDFVSGEAPKDKKSEWEILGTRNRAALNQNFARELPLEYRATLKNYYERVAK